VLRARIITALILLPLVLGAIYLLPLPAFAAAFWLIVAAAGWEWAALAGLEGGVARGAFVLVLALGAMGLWWFPAGLPGGFTAVLLAAAAFWLVAIVVVVAYPRSGAWLRPPVLLASGVLTMLAAWVALVVVRSAPAGANWLLWVMVVVWAADIGAYFVGRRFGRRRLAPQVSPGKSWEGAAGGAALALLVAAGLLVAGGVWAPGWLLVILGLVAVSIFGDLFESVLKRHRGVKDSGNLLPGHGGALDRIDSLLAVLPFFALILQWSMPAAGGS